jgi:hypothetical protein
MRYLLSLVILATALAFSPGCNHTQLDPAGVYQGQVAAYNADSTINTAYALMDNFLKWEFENRAVFAETPEVKKFADNIRANGRQWISSAIALNEAYKLDPTEEKRSALVAALDLIDVALMEATKYMIKKPL